MPFPEPAPRTAMGIKISKTSVLDIIGYLRVDALRFGASEAYGRISQLPGLLFYCNGILAALLTFSRRIMALLDKNREHDLYNLPGDSSL